MRIGYVPYSADLQRPGDRRRFPFYARRRGLAFELADPRESYDLVVVTPRADTDRWCRYRPGEAKVVFDIVDSYLDIPRHDAKALLRGPAKFLARQARHPFFSYRAALERMLERADAVTCATPEQAEAIRPLCANVHPILDFQSQLVRRVKGDYDAGVPFRIVWEGLGENVRWFSEIAPVLREVHARHPLELHLVTAVEFGAFMQRFGRRTTASVISPHFSAATIHPWSEESVSAVATGCDVAVIPLPLDRPLERGKSENKLVSFWRMGMPALTSATPAYARTMRQAGQDLSCASPAEWTEKLTDLVEDRGLRERAGRSGREFAEDAYGEERLLEAWDRMLATL